MINTNTETMTTKEIHKLASELSEQEVMNIIAGWENDNEKKVIESYNSLVKLGDSMQLACATIIAEKINRPFMFEPTNLADPYFI